MRYRQWWFVSLCFWGQWQAQAQEPVVEPDWIDIPQHQLVYLQTKAGTSVMLLADEFTPKNTAQFRQLVQQRFYDGLSFYRVIDQFVLQAGLPEERVHPHGKLKPAPIVAEFQWPIPSQSTSFVQVQQPDSFADVTGYRKLFAVGRDSSSEWLITCPNVVVMARSNEANSATSDFAIMQGQAPRHLDQNMSVIGRMIWGVSLLNQVQRAAANSDGLVPMAKQSPILTMQLGADREAKAQLPLQIQNPAGPQFLSRLHQARTREHAFYQAKGRGVLDICYYSLAVRLKPA